MNTYTITEQEALNMMADDELFRMIDLNAYCIASLDPERLTPAIVDYAMNVNNAVFWHIPKDKLTPFCARLIATTDCCRFPCLPAELVTPDIQILALKHYPLLLLTCELIEINEINCCVAINRMQYRFLENIENEHLWNYRRRERLSEISRVMLKWNPFLFKWIQNPTEEECKVALKVNPHMLSKMQKQTFEMCWIACRQMPECVQYVKKKDIAGRILSLLLRREDAFDDPMSLVAGFV